MALGIGFALGGGFSWLRGYGPDTWQFYASGITGAATAGLGYVTTGVTAFAADVALGTAADTLIFGDSLGGALASNVGANLAFATIGRGVRHLTPIVWGHPNTRASVVSLEDFVNRVFNGDWDTYRRFVDTLDELPEGTTAVARGSSVTGYKWTTGRSFDWQGPGMSDIDLVLMGDKVMKEWLPSEFKIPGLYTANLGDATPHVAPRLNSLRLELQTIAGRPINIQAASQVYMDVRHFVQGKPYLTLIKK